MNQKTLTKLEYHKIIAMLEEQASSFRGRQLCRKLKPMTNLDKINTSQKQTAAAFTRLIKKGRISFSDAAPVEESMKRLEVGGSSRKRRITPHSQASSNSRTCQSIWPS